MNTLVSIKKTTQLPEFMTAEDEVRAEAVAFRALLLDIQAGNLPRPSHIALGRIDNWKKRYGDNPYTPGQVSFQVKDLTEIRALRRYLGGKYAKDITEWSVTFKGKWRGLTISITCSRDAVCEKVSDGYETVEVKEEATPATYTVKKERVEKFKWVCPDL